MDIPTALLSDMIQAYHELNVDRVDELTEEPSALAFLRYVARNRPFVIRGAARRTKAFEQWKLQYLEDKLRTNTIQVAVTPDGRADAPRPFAESPESALCFAKPLEVEMTFSDFMSHFKRHSTSTEPEGRHEHQDEVWYAQTQNDNLRGEYASVLDDVDKEIRWASIALEQPPDAVNMWIGDSRSSTALHKDPYQNIFCQLVGEKHFVLISPIETACVNEQLLPQATWVREETGMSLRIDQDAPSIPCALWNPERPDDHPSELSGKCKPLRITLQAGDLMYLPAMWYHQVSQTEGREGFCCSVNYWYDMEYGGSFFPHDQLIRALSRAAAKPPMQPH